LLLPSWECSTRWRVRAPAEVCVSAHPLRVQPLTDGCQQRSWFGSSPPPSRCAANGRSSSERTSQFCFPGVVSDADEPDQWENAALRERVLCRRRKVGVYPTGATARVWHQSEAARARRGAPWHPGSIKLCSYFIITQSDSSR
jgi:hypothetical protein